MSFSVARRAAFGVSRNTIRPVYHRTYAAAGADAGRDMGEEVAEKKDVLRKGAKRDPELYVSQQAHSQCL